MSTLISMPRLTVAHADCEGCAKCASLCFDTWSEHSARPSFVSVSDSVHLATLGRH